MAAAAAAAAAVPCARVRAFLNHCRERAGDKDVFTRPSLMRGNKSHAMILATGMLRVSAKGSLYSGATRRSILNPRAARRSVPPRE